jgi:RNA polymerase sigma-70 factor
VRGPLAGWVRVLAVRLTHDLLQASHVVQVQAADVRLWERLATPDPELEYFKGVYLREFRAAFLEAFAALDRTDRNMIRHHHLDGISLKEVGRLYGFHEATASRRLAQLRAGLLKDVRARLMGRLQVDREQLESILRLIESRLDAGPLEGTK